MHKMKTQAQAQPQEEPKLDKKALARRWNVSIRSVERIRKRYGLIACGFFGRQPEFTLQDVLFMEARRNADREVMLRDNCHAKVITLAEVKRRAGR